MARVRDSKRKTYYFARVSPQDIIKIYAEIVDGLQRIAPVVSTDATGAPTD